MADKKSKQFPHQWPDGTWHSITYQQHVINTNQKTSASDYYNQAGYSPANVQEAQAALGVQVTGPQAGQPTAAAAAAAAPVTPQPFDPALEDARQGAQWRVGINDAESAYQRARTAYESGYDANGLRNMANPYAQAQLFEDDYKRSLAGVLNGAGNQLYSGAYGRAKGREDRLYAQQSDRLQRDTANAYHGIGAGQLQTYGENSLGVSGEARAALKRSIYGS